MSLQLGLVYTSHFSWNWFSYWVHHPFGGTDARNPWLVMDETSRSSHELFGCPRFSGKIGVGSVGTMIDEYWWYVYICFIFFHTVWSNLTLQRPARLPSLSSFIAQSKVLSTYHSISQLCLEDLISTSPNNSRILNFPVLLLKITIFDR